MNRRTFLRLLGIGAAATASGIIVPELIAKPERRFWQVGMGAPVGPRFDMFTERTRDGIDRQSLNDTTLFQINADGYPLWYGRNLTPAKAFAAWPKFEPISPPASVQRAHVFYAPPRDRLSEIAKRMLAEDYNRQTFDEICEFDLTPREPWPTPPPT
jgi:hypothetical protein